MLRVTITFFYKDTWRELEVNERDQEEWVQRLLDMGVERLDVATGG